MRHGSIALGAWAVRTGRVPVDPSGVTDVLIEVPSGRVTARVRTDGERVVSVDFVNVAGYLLHERVVAPNSRGDVPCAISFGGAIYARRGGGPGAGRGRGLAARAHRGRS